MVATLTTEFAELAIELIDETIPTTNAVWNSLADGVASNPAEPWNVERGVPSTTNIKMLFVESEHRNEELIRYLVKTELSVGTLLGFMYPQGFTPKQKDFVTWNGWHLIANTIREIRPIDDVILYIIEFGL